MLAVSTIAEIALRRNDGFCDSQHLVGCAKAKHIGQARKRGGVAVCHPHATTNSDIEARNLTVFDDRDETKVL